MQNTSADQSTTPEPILTTERLTRWFDIIDEALGIKQPEADQK